MFRNLWNDLNKYPHVESFMYTFRCCNKHSEEVGTRDVHIVRQSWTGLNKLSENIQPDSMERAESSFANWCQ